MSIDLCRPFFDKLCQFSNWTPHEAQNEALTAFFNGQRFLAPVFGRRSGKTDVAAHLCRYAMSQSNKLIWACAPSYDLCGRLWDFLLPIAKQAYGNALRPRYAKPASMSLPWGTRIEFKSAESPDSMIGAGVDFLIWDEAAPTKNGGMIWQQQLRPTLADKLGQCLMITTPRGHNWFHDLVQNDEWWMKQYPSHCNPYLERTELAAMQKEMDPIVYKQEVLAQFVAFVGMVYTMFDPERHVISDRDAAERTRDWSTSISVDPGLGNPTCIQLIKHNRIDGQDVVIRDHQASGMLFDDVLRMINEWRPACGYEAEICDIAGKQRSQETGASFVGWMRSNGHMFQHAGIRSVTEGINMVRGRLLNTENVTRLWCAEAATHTVKALLNYHYNDKPGPQGEEPVKDNVYDHASDALRYYVTWRYAPKTSWKQH
jgi:hypothetical protein